MEPVGLAVGLVGLFSACMDVMQRVDSYRTAGRDSRQLDAQLNATMHLFERWGDGVGISRGKLSENHHQDLDNPRTFAVVQGLLNSIKDFSHTPNDLQGPKSLQKTPSFQVSEDLSSHGPKVSKWQKTAWALRGKLKQTSHIQTLASLVSDLYSVISPDTTGSKALTRTPSFKDLSISAGGQSYAVEIRELLHKIEEEMEADKLRDLHLWLGAPPPNDVFSDSKDKRVEKTCEWILHREEFLYWQKPSSSSKLLWIKGPAGFGKTVLCARIVQELERTAQEPVAYFFLSSRYDGRDDPFSAIRTWLTMLIHRSSVARDIVTKARLSEYEPLASQATILRVFREVIVGVPDCIIVLDGLDECTGMTNTDTKSVPHFLQELRVATANTKTKILISSRGDPVIQQGISDFTGRSEYTIIPDDVGPDLMAYSSEIVRAKLPNKDEPTRVSIAQKMKNRSEGQFQWVKLQEGSLRKGRSRKQLEREIDETPSGLDSLYDREWNRINSMGNSDKDRALSLLRWAAFALIPLTVYQITEAALIAGEMLELPLEEMPDCVDQDYLDSMILELCGSLIEVRPLTSPEDPERIQKSEEDSIGLQEVHLSHFSVKEFLLLKTFPGTNTLLSNEKLRVTNDNFHSLTLAKHCIRFMNLHGAFESLKMNNSETSGKHFVFYAVSYGFEHCRHVQAVDPELQQAIIALLDSRSENWPFVKDHLEADMRVDPEFQGSSISPFVFAAYSGLTDAMAHFIREGSLDMDDRSFGNSTPLFLACTFNWNSSCQDIVEMLVENGADINARCYQGQTALHVSAFDEDNGATGILLAKGADVSVVDDDGKTALNVALEYGNTKAARLIVDAGADVSHETADGFTPLSMASYCGYVDLVKILIESGADVNQVVLKGHSSLLHAVENDHSEVVELLIDKGANLTNVKVDGRVFSLLDVAAGHGNVNTFKALVGKGVAPTNPQTLFLATSYGYYHGFILAFYNKWDPTLSYFHRSSYYKILELLLQSGAQVNAFDEGGDSPLYAASFMGFTDIVEILIKNGADVDIRSASGDTPLHCCSRMGHLAVTQLLLQNGADVASKDNCGRTPLHHACRSGNIEVANLIIGSSHTQGLDEADPWGSTSLSIAARLGSVGIVRALIDTGAVEVKSSDAFGRTTTWWATNRNHDAVVRLLVSTDGTDIEEVEAIQEHWLEIGTYCDICWLAAPGQTLVHCGICKGGDFDVCSACLSLGGHCFDETHELVPFEAEAEN